MCDWFGTHHAVETRIVTVIALKVFVKECIEMSHSEFDVSLPSS